MELGERGTKLLRRNDPRLPGVLMDKFIKKKKETLMWNQKPKTTWKASISPTWNPIRITQKRQSAKSIHCDNKSKVGNSLKRDVVTCTLILCNMLYKKEKNWKLCTKMSSVIDFLKGKQHWRLSLPLISRKWNCRLKQKRN